MSTYVPGEGPCPAPVMIVGEGPGRDEDREGRPFVGVSGWLLNNALARAGLRRDQVYITNVVKERCVDEDGKDRPPTAAEVETFAPILDAEIASCNPELIVSLGRTAAKALLDDDIDMSSAHGMVRYSERYQTRVFISYHPAAGLHSPDLLGDFFYDMSRLQYVRVNQQFDAALLALPKPQFHDLGVQIGAIVAIDTEGTQDNPFCLTYATWLRGHDQGLVGRYISADDRAGLQDFKSLLIQRARIDPFFTVLLHNALHDLGVLRALGIDLVALKIPFQDTMVLASVSGEPQGLKDLGPRYFSNLQMISYSDLIVPYQISVGVDYLRRVQAIDWGPAEPVLVFDPDGTPRIKKPRSLNSRVNKILADVAAGKPVDLLKRWNDVEVKAPAENYLGPMPEATLANVPLPKAMDYAVKDAVVTLEISPWLQSRVQNTHTRRVADLDNAVIPILDRMQQVGLPVNVPYFDTLATELDTMAEAIGLQINTIAGRAISPSSGDQVADLLFRDLKLPASKMTNSGLRESTTDKILEGLAHLHPVVKLITDHREVTKLKGTFVSAIRKFVRDGRIHPRIRLTRVGTGRISTADPNVMAFPVRTELGRKIRKGFVAPRGLVWGTWDLSQIEVRVLAHLSGDSRLIQLFWSGRDIYTEIAADFYKIPYDQVSKTKHRQPVKSMVLGVMYGIGAKKLSQELRAVGLEYTEQQCQDIINQFFALYPGVAAWVKRQHEFVAKYGYITTAMGRIRKLGGIFSPNKWERAEALRQAQNTPVQGGAADLIKQVMVDLWVLLQELWQARVYIEPLLQIHDEMLFLFRPEDWELIDALISKAMTSVRTHLGEPYSVPLVVGSTMAETWGDLEK